MEIRVSQGEWMNSLISRMSSAGEMDCFLLPTKIHMHAFELVWAERFPDRSFHVKIAS